MATGIQWTDETWNPVTGCVKVSPGCKHCYAEVISKRFVGHFEPRVHPDRFDKPRHWRKPRRVFVNSMSDLFGEFVTQPVLEQVFSTMRGCPQHTFQVLTKRAERMAQWTLRLPWLAIARHIWLGVSVEDRKYGLPRIDALRSSNAAVRFLSVEPLLEDLGELDLRAIDWVIVGGESGPGARPFDVAWARSIIDQCRAAKVACFVKQLGAHVIDRNDAGFDGCEPESWPFEIEERDAIEHDLDGTRDGFQGAPVRVHLLDRKGGDMAEWPEDLRVRQFPAQVA